MIPFEHLLNPYIKSSWYHSIFFYRKGGAHQYKTFILQDNFDVCSRMESKIVSTKEFEACVHHVGVKSCPSFLRYLR